MIHAHNPYHANDKSYAFDITGHGDEALPTNLLVRNRAITAIDSALGSGSRSYSADILPEHVAGVRLAINHYRHTKTHHIGVVSNDAGHVLRVVRRRHHA
jgi:hypothetical protein